MFETERRILGAAYRQNLALWGASVAGALFAVLLPAVFAGQLPRAVKTVSVVSAVSLGGFSALVASKLTGEARKYQQAMEQSSQQIIKTQVEQTHAKAALAQKMQGLAEVHNLVATIHRSDPALAALMVEKLKLPVNLPRPRQTARRTEVATVDVASMPIASSPEYSPAIAPNPVDWEQEYLDDQHNDALPEFRDLAKEISDYPRHIGFVSKTQSGKTTILIQSILHDLAAGREVFIIDGKGDRRFSVPGVQYVLANSPRKMDRAIALIEVLMRRVESRYDGDEATDKGISLYVDENNLILSHAQNAGIEGSDGIKRDHKWWGMATQQLLLQGASANVRLRVSSHTSRCQDWGWNTGVMDSISFIALARCGEYESIEDLLKYQVPTALRESAKAQLTALTGISLNEPIALCLLPPGGFCRVPRYEIPLFEEHPKGWKPAAPSLENPDLASTYQALRQLNLETNEQQGRDLTDEELVLCYKELTGQDISPNALNALWAIVNAHNS